MIFFILVLDVFIFVNVRRRFIVKKVEDFVNNSLLLFEVNLENI